jgi:hypothetical protein
MKTDMYEELEILRNMVRECLDDAYTLNDILDEDNDEALSITGKIINNLELGVNAL